MQTSINSDHTGVETRDEEKIFVTDYFRIEFTSAYFPTEELMYAMAVRLDLQQNELVQFNWTGTVRVWKMRGLSEHPRAQPYQGNPFFASIIYAELDDINSNISGDNFPV